MIMTKMNEIVEERYQFCIWLNLIARERGVGNVINVDLFRDFLKTPQYTEVASLRGYTDYMRCLTHHENKLFSGNYNTIRIWNTETYEEITTLEGHTDWVSCLTHYDNKLYSVSDDKEKK